MEKANNSGLVQKARYISVVPAALKEIAMRMEFEAEHSNKSREKVFFQLTDDIVLFYDPEDLNVIWPAKKEE